MYYQMHLSIFKKTIFNLDHLVSKNVQFLKQSVLSKSREYETHLVSHIPVSQIKVLYTYSLHRFMIRLKTMESISVSVDTR